MLYFDKRSGLSEAITESQFKATECSKAIVKSTNGTECHLVDTPEVVESNYKTIKLQAQASNYLTATEGRQVGGNLTANQIRLRVKAAQVLNAVFVEPASDLFDVE